MILLTLIVQIRKIMATENKFSPETISMLERLENLAIDCRCHLDDIRDLAYMSRSGEKARARYEDAKEHARILVREAKQLLYDPEIENPFAPLDEADEYSCRYHEAVWELEDAVAELECFA